MATEINYAIVHTMKAKIKNAVSEVLNATLKESADVSLDKETLKDAIVIRYSLDIGDDRRLSGIAVRFDLDNGIDESQDIIAEFCDALGGKENIVHVLKFSDPVQFEIQKRFVDEIYQVEMKLREALTIIFIKAYGNNFYNLLDNSDVKIRDDIANQEHMQATLENEFFYLFFSDYIKVNNRKPTKIEDLLSLIQQTNEFSALRSELITKPITNPDHSSFIASLISNLKSIEDLRNCIAHNRAFARDTIENYQMAKGKLIAELDNFFKNLENFAPPTADHPSADLKGNAILKLKRMLAKSRKRGR